MLIRVHQNRASNVAVIVRNHESHIGVQKFCFGDFLCQATIFVDITARIHRISIENRIHILSINRMDGFGRFVYFKRMTAGSFRNKMAAAAKEKPEERLASVFNTVRPGREMQRRITKTNNRSTIIKKQSG